MIVEPKLKKLEFECIGRFDDIVLRQKQLALSKTNLKSDVTSLRKRFPFDDLKVYWGKK